MQKETLIADRATATRKISGEKRVTGTSLHEITYLGYASYYGLSPLDLGVDVEEKDDEDMAALNIGVNGKRVELVEQLLQSEAKFHFSDLIVSESLKDAFHSDDEKTLKILRMLFKAVVMEHLECCKA